MGNKTTLLLGLGAMIFGGCYSGVDDAGDGAAGDRFGKTCYYSYASNQSASYKASSSNDDAASVKTEDGFKLTINADPASYSAEQSLEILDALRFQAASSSQYFIQTSCGGEEGFGQLIDSCKDTCAQQGLAMDDVVLCDPECELVDDGSENGSIQCWGALTQEAEEALSKPWSGETEWVFQSEGMTLVMSPPALEEGKDGLVWASQVHVTGFCLCACTAG